MRIIGVVIGFSFIFFLFGIINIYASKRLYQAIRFLFPRVKLKIYATVYAIITLSILFAFLPLPRTIDSVINFISSYWMGILVYLVMLFLVSDIVISMLRLFKVIPKPTPAQIRFYASMIVVILTASIVIYGIYNAYQIKHVSYDIQINKTESNADMKIVLISDLHLGAVNSEKNLNKIVEGVNKMTPDLVCIAGDIFNDDFYAIRNPDKAKELLSSIDSTYGVYASLGNHDGGKTFNLMTSFLEQSNVTLLNDEHVIIDGRLVLIGRVDASPIGAFDGIKRKDISEILFDIDTSMPIVVMDHTPSNTGQYGNEIDLVLSGHTHKGQLYPFNYVTNAIFTVDYGHYRKDAQSPNFIVTSGAGTWGMPMRVGTSNEIVSINLR